MHSALSQGGGNGKKYTRHRVAFRNYNQFSFKGIINQRSILYLNIFNASDFQRHALDIRNKYDLTLLLLILAFL